MVSRDVIDQPSNCDIDVARLNPALLRWIDCVASVMRLCEPRSPERSFGLAVRDITVSPIKQVLMTDLDSQAAE